MGAMNHTIKEGTNQDMETIHDYLNDFFRLKMEGISLRPNPQNSGCRTDLSERL